MFPPHYQKWQRSRLNGMLKYIDQNFFKNLEIIELGAGNGYFGKYCYDLGSVVTCVDIRQEYLNSIKKDNPQIKTMLIDCDGSIEITQVDLIIHFSLLQHISKVDQHLISLKGKCKYLLLESEILNTTQNTFQKITENGKDQSYHGIGSKYSSNYIEHLLGQIGFKYKRIDDPIFNSDFHEYDWIENDGSTIPGMRRFWICWTDNCPIKPDFFNNVAKCYNSVDDHFMGMLEYTNKSNWKQKMYTGNIDYYFGEYRDIKPNKGMVIVAKSGDDIKKLDLYTLETSYCYNNAHYLFYRKNGVVYDNVTIIIQGRDTPTTILTACFAFINAKIVISTWNKYNFEQIEHNVKKNGYHNRGNIYYQLYTTLQGLELVTTKYVIKIRSDEIYSNFDNLIDLMINNPKYIITGNQFIRPIRSYPYHISDHLICGKTENLSTMCKNANYLIESRKVSNSFFDKYRMVPEQILTIGYLYGLNPGHTFSITNAKLDMITHFISISPEEMGGYLLSAFRRLYKYPDGQKLVDLPSYNSL